MVKTTEQKIKEKESELSKLKDQLKKEQDTSEWIYIKELGIEIQTKIHHKNKSYDELVEEYGKEYLEKNLPTYAQLQFLRNSKKYMNKLGLEDTWEFVQQEDEISKKNGKVARFYANSDYADLDCCWYSGNSYSDLGVRFCKKLKGKKQ